jgi:glycogen(starch) synthase
MRLLIYSHFFAPSVGGVETVVLLLARGLASLRDSNGEKGFEVTLVTQTPAGECDDGAFPFRVIRRPAWTELWRAICASDVVHVAGPALKPLIFGRFAGKPVVVEHHGFQTICPNGQLLIEPAGTPCPGHFMAGRHAECIRCNTSQGWMASRKLWLLTFLRRFLCGGVAANIAPTQWLGGLVQLPNLTAIPHGLEATAVSVRPEGQPERPVIAFVGRLVTTKGVRLLFEAARILREQNRSFELLIIGDGPERTSLESYARTARISERVQFAGRLPDAQIEKELAKSFAVVVPSLGGEVFGLVVAENMLRALPVVASDLGAFVEVLGNGGATFHTADASDLASKLVQLLDDPVSAAQLGQRGRLRALEFYSLPRMVDAHAAVYRRLISGAAG